MRRRTPFRRLGLLTALAGGAALAVALGSETWGGLVPCALCLVERWPYRIAVALGVAAMILPRMLGRAALMLGALAFLAAAGLGFVHVGVEQGFWPSPLPECAAPDIGGGSIAERLSRMPARPSKPCDEPTYLIPSVPLSMAAMNTLYALAVSAWLAMSVGQSRRGRF